MPEPSVVASRTGIVATEHATPAHINLRGDPLDARLTAALREAVGAPLPLQANTFVAAGGNSICWLGPDEWLLIADEWDEDELAAALRGRLHESHVAVTAVGGGHTVIALRGAAAGDLLSRECPLDFDLRSFQVGACAQSRLAKAPVFVRRFAVDSFEIVIRRSFAGYLRSWLRDAICEHRP